MRRTVLLVVLLLAVVAVPVLADLVPPTGDAPSSAPTAADASTRPTEPSTSPTAAPMASIDASPSPESLPTIDPTPTPTLTPTPTAPAEPPMTTTGEGWELALGTGPVVGSDGPLVTYRVEREPGVAPPMSELLAVATSALENPDQGWTATAERRLQRVDGEASVRVVLASPATVDAHCARAGLRTNGIFSCWVGDRAMLNADRWDRGTSDMADIDQYRTYLVNHEVGHGLGFGHRGCPGRGAVAPVMMQQTKTTDGCEPNGWPHP